MDSTTLVGIIRPTSGTLTIAGHAPGEPAGLAKIGSLIESPGFYPYLSGRENILEDEDRAGLCDLCVRRRLARSATPPSYPSAPLPGPDAGRR
jgi:ABC-2 type transport system ATP-binding protein